MATIWAANCPGGIHLKEWDGEFVVYSDSTASTHLLAPATAAVLLAFLESPTALSFAEICQRLELPPVSDDSPTEGEHAALADILDELENIELIEAVTI